MAAPEHVPTKVTDAPRGYVSPPRRPDSWTVDRPGYFAASGRQPSRAHLGIQGPDQGYALKLAHLIEDDLVLHDGEHARDAIAGIVAVGLKRAALIGRAPVLDDLRIGATLFGYLDPAADPALVRWRKDRFEEVGHFHHYRELRHIADLVQPDVLRRTQAQVQAGYAANWRDQIGLANS